MVEKVGTPTPGYLMEQGHTRIDLGMMLRAGRNQGRKGRAAFPGFPHSTDSRPGPIEK